MREKPLRQPVSSTLVVTKVFQAESFVGMQHVNLDDRVSIQDCLGLVEAMNAATAQMIARLMSQEIGRENAPGQLSVILAVWQRGEKDCSLLNDTEFIVQELSREPALWRLYWSPSRDSTPSWSQAGLEEVCRHLASFAGYVYTSWLADRWDLPRQQARRMYFDPNRRPPECLRPVAQN